MLHSFNLKIYLFGLLSFMLVIQINAQEAQADLGQIDIPKILVFYLCIYAHYQ